MKKSKSPIKDNNNKVRLYIHTTKAYYYPGEKLGASILIDVFEKIKCDKLQAIAKGKLIIKTTQRSPDSDDEDELFETIEKDNQEKDSNKDKKNKKAKKKKIMREFNDEDSSSSGEEEGYKVNSGEKKKISETKEIFKFKKIIKISNEEFLNQGKYTIPLELELPEKIPGTFLYKDKKKGYVEIAYSLKVKLNKIMLKEVIPIVIRQRESVFNYKKSNEFEKKILGCCFDNNIAKIQVSTEKKYYLSNEEILLNIVVDNKKNDIIGVPLNVELYQRIILFPKDRIRKKKITNLVAVYNGKKVVLPRRIYHKDKHFYIKKQEISLEDLNEIKAMKHYKHKDVISFLNSSINSDLIICEYEAYSYVTYPNWNDQELGVFISVLVYPPTEGILSKTVDQIAKGFNNSIINKKIFLSEEQNKADSKNVKYENEFKKKKFYKYNDGSDEKFMKKIMELEKEKEFEKKKKSKKNEDENDDDEDEDNKKKKNKKDFENINDDENDDNININNKNNKKNKEDNLDKSLHSKKQISDIDTVNSLVIKKDFTGDFLKDPLDNEFLDKESFQ